MDDDSTDDTRDIAARVDGVTVLSPDPEFAGYAAKKRPLASGIARAHGDIILTTDADCTVPETWIQTMVSHFTDDIDVVAGYSKIAPVSSGPVHTFQSFDFHALLSAAAGIIGVGGLWAATGQNLGYRKSAYEQVGGFSVIADRPSGDDVLLMQLFRQAGMRAAFCFDPAGHATTWRSEPLAGLINQRKRWASNAAVQLRLNPMLFAYVTSVLIVNVLPIAALGFGGAIAQACATIWAVRIVLDTTVVGLAAQRMKVPFRLRQVPLWLVLQIPYVIVVGVGGSLLGFEWKDRAHSAVPGISVPYTLNDQPESNHGTM